MARWVKEDGESEGRPVIGRIEAEPSGNIASRESGQASIWSFGTREFVKPSKGAKQMTATQQLAGAASHVAVRLSAINWRDAHKNVRRLQARIVQATRGKGDGGK